MDEPRSARWRPMFVVGIPGARPKTRAFVTERTWAYQTKPAFSDAAPLAPWLRNRNRAHCFTRSASARLVVALPRRAGLGCDSSGAQPVR